MNERIVTVLPVHQIRETSRGSSRKGISPHWDEILMAVASNSAIWPIPVVELPAPEGPYKYETACISTVFRALQVLWELTGDASFEFVKAEIVKRRASPFQDPSGEWNLPTDSAAWSLPARLGHSDRSAPQDLACTASPSIPSHPLWPPCLSGSNDALPRTQTSPTGSSSGPVTTFADEELDRARRLGFAPTRH